jgi:hypothetical protein
LRLLFAAWVVSPIAAILTALVIAKGWRPSIRAALNIIALVVMTAARAARKLDQWAARKVDHLRAVHSTLFCSETTMIGCGNVGISRSVRDFQAAVEIVL